MRANYQRSSEKEPIIRLDDYEVIDKLNTTEIIRQISRF